MTTSKLEVVYLSGLSGDKNFWSCVNLVETVHHLIMDFKKAYNLAGRMFCTAFSLSFVYL
jgi:hypothetical protein